MQRVLPKSIRFALPLIAAVAASSGSCFAWYGPNGPFFDGHTRYMWSRTWHGPNSLATPLNQYYVPRTPGNCGSGGYAGGMGCQAGVAGQYGALPYTANAAAGFEPVQFERLGQVPNELDVIGNMAAPPAGPGGAPRR